MSTKSKASRVEENDPICQGDIFKDVKYSYIDSEDDTTVKIVEFEFPYAIILSQACDVTAMNKILNEKKGKLTKFMPSVLMCPIYDKDMAKKGNHIVEIFDKLSIDILQENFFQRDDYQVAERDWHYRFHALSIYVNEEKLIDNSILDFKHYFTIPASYLIYNKKNRLYRIDNLYAEQLTLKFATYLSRVAIP